MSRIVKTAELENTLPVKHVVLAEPENGELLRRVFGSRLDAVKKIDPAPMLLMATGLLDRGDVRNGEQTWILGWTKIWMTDAQYRNEFAPALFNKPGHRGHVWSGEFQEAALTVVWSGMDDRSGSPSAILYVRPSQTALREAIREADSLDSLSFEFPLSLNVEIDIDDETDKMTKVMNPERWGLDLVRRQGTKDARIKEAINLAEEKERAMLTFESNVQMLEHPDVKALAESKAKMIVGDPASVKKMVLAAPIDYIKERDDVKVFLSRSTREEVLKSVTPDEIGVVLSAETENVKALRDKAVKVVTELSEKVKTFCEKKVKPILLEAGFDEPRIATIMVGHDFSHLDEARVKQLAETIKTGLLGGNGGGGESHEKGGLPDSNAMSAEERKSQKAYLER